MVASECEKVLANYGFSVVVPGARLVQIDHQMVPFVTWRLGEFDVEVYYFWPGREYPEEVTAELGLRNAEAAAKAKEYSQVHQVLEFCS